MYRPDYDSKSSIQCYIRGLDSGIYAYCARQKSEAIQTALQARSCATIRPVYIALGAVVSVLAAYRNDGRWTTTWRTETSGCLQAPRGFLVQPMPPERRVQEAQRRLPMGHLEQSGGSPPVRATGRHQSTCLRNVLAACRLAPMP
jgi:hypothetical protein